MKNSPTPWKSLSSKDGFDPCIVDTKGMYVSVSSDEFREHVVQCVNACAGMNDPVAEIEQLRSMASGRATVKLDDHISHAIDHDSIRSMYSIKESPPWHELGQLPPVGTECEIAASTEHLNIRHPEGEKVKIYAAFTDDRGVSLAAFVGAKGKTGGVATAKCFRPIQTEKQKTIKEMLECFDNFFSADGPTDNAGDVCEKIYNKFIAKKV